MVTATFRFHGELNDFLVRERQGRTFSCPCALAATTKHMIEALGIPHTEVELVLVNEEPSGFDRLLSEGDHVEIFPSQAEQRSKSTGQCYEATASPKRLIADAHLGGLARLLRMAGFDTLYDNNFQDKEIAEIAQRDQRIVLTRDRELLKRREISHGCYVRALDSTGQMKEVFGRLNLARDAQPFTLCLRCNVRLHPIEKACILDRLPPSVQIYQEEFSTCPRCDGLFWKGSHWQRMNTLMHNMIHGI